MKNTRIIALAVAVLLSVSIAGVSLAEEAQLPTPDITAAPETVIDAAPVAVQAPQASEVPVEPAYTSDTEATQTPAETMTESTPAPETTAEAEAPAETLAPETEAPAETAAPQTEAPAETAAPAESAAPVANRNVSIEMIVPKGLQYGDTVTLVATLSGYEGLNVSLQWQYSYDGENWFDAEGANALRYSFAVSQEMAGTGWRLAVTVL